MAKVNPDVKEAYEQVRSNNDPTNWLLAHYVDNNTIGLQGTGTGGVQELQSQLEDNGCQYGFFRVDYEDDGTQRTKFAMLHWAGPDAPVMRKAKMSVHKADLKRSISDFNVEIQESDSSVINHDEIVKRIRKINY